MRCGVAGTLSDLEMRYPYSVNVCRHCLYIR